jgi:hypothetical protein
MQHDTSIDYSVLVDIISNVAGMMIMLACVALLVQQKDIEPVEDQKAKPISFPLAYVPVKRSLTLCIKYGNFYQLPEEQLLRAVAARTSKGETVGELSLVHRGVEGRIALTPTTTGFSFRFRLLPSGGLPAVDSLRMAETLDRLLERFPPDRFFYVIQVWPEDDGFRRFREVREYLHERGVEVGWTPGLTLPPTDDGQPRPDIIYSIGEYNEKLSTIKAQ